MSVAQLYHLYNFACRNLAGSRQWGHKESEKTE